jgi:hypothetical protein
LVKKGKTVAGEPADDKKAGTEKKGGLSAAPLI